MRRKYLLVIVILIMFKSYANPNNAMSLGDDFSQKQNQDFDDYRSLISGNIIYLEHLDIFLSVEVDPEYRLSNSFPDVIGDIREEKGALTENFSEKYRNSNFFYTLMPVYQSNGTIGLEMGELNLNGIGWFGSLKANLGVTKAASPYEEVDRNSINKENYDLGAASLSGGITKSLVYPLYLYVGGGIAYHKYYYKDSDDDVIAINLKDESGYYPFPEAALGVQFGSMAIKGGAAYIDEEIYFNVGIGFGG